MDDEKPLQALIEESRGGSVDSFRLLYDRLSDRLFLHVRSRTQTRDDALDVMQETFIDFWKSLDGFAYTSDSALRAFLYRIASRRISKLYGRWGASRATFDEAADLVRDPGDVETRREAALAADTLRKLGKADREVIELRYYAGLTFGEIASLTAQTEGAAKVRHHRAIAKLKKLMGYE